MRPAYEIALLDEALADETRTAAASKTCSGFNFLCRMNAALFKSTSIRRCTSLCPMASIDRATFPSQPSSRPSYACGDDDGTSKSKLHQRPSSTPRFGRKKAPHFFLPNPILQTQAP
jgi:hypothetical protein